MTDVTDVTDVRETEEGVQPRIDPRFARRWVEVRREAGRRRLRVVVVAAVLAGLIAAGTGSLYSPLWKVRHVRVTVAGAMSASRVRSLAGLAHYRLMIDINAGRIARRLDSIPQLGGAKVRTEWPSTVRIQVAVRTPVALVEVIPPGAQAAAWMTLDATGRVLARSAAAPPGLPVISGVTGAPPAVGQWLAGSAGPDAPPGGLSAVDMNAASDSPSVPVGASAALAVAAAVPRVVRAEMLGISVNPSGSLAVSVLPAGGTAGAIEVQFGDGSQLARKLSALVALLDHADLSGVQSIDLTVPSRPAALTAR